MSLISNGDLSYTVADGTVSSTVDTFTGNDVEIRGLDVGTYYLVETSAPTGYNKVEYPIEITFERNEKFQSSNKVGLEHGIVVVNNTGTLLPETGGTGRTILYTAGSIFTVAAIVVIVTKKRMKYEK